ncbi:cyclin-like protein [Dactylonectria macrodidyma]|uniref:Cyclin-like protein n=1 Tax=Dactylonectria macrodidyma TaxID=307937 RepID=A0A9P9JFN5_9HYPO|nr:cyclin-like protein [Dactylonectria macrodidyma]
MDARPFRPRGAENAPQLHQRHKSMGNLSTMSSASNAGFRGPAKRAAFGDVTNLSKHVGHGREEGKVLKVYANNNSSVVAVPLNKENVLIHAKEAFSRPAQRAGGGFAANPRGGLEAKASDVNKKIVRSDSQENRPSCVKKDTQPKPSHTVSTGLNSRPLQPRHHKSQPQLKQQQPTLRRTQSKQLETVVAKQDIIETSNEDAEAAAMALQEVDYAHTHAAYLDSLYLPTELEAHIDAKHQDDYAELPAKLTEIAEEEIVVPVSYEGAPLPAMSEPEECWDEEDDEDFDDQDQAYTTAHSFRSRDMTSGGATTVVPPRVTARVQRELEEAKLEVERTRTQDDIEEELWDVSMVAEYGDDIFEYMRELEIKMLPNPHYMDIQTEIQWSMRSVLMDWLVQVHNRFGLLPETLFLTVNYIDRFLSAKIVSIGKLQLVGATAILVASKYEEINCPSLQEIVYMVDNGYTADEVLKAERFMLSMLNFELGWPGPMSFLRRVSKADDYDLETRTLAKYFLELTIMDERFVASPPSFLAAGAHCLSRLILNKGDWSKAHVHYSGYSWSQLKSLVTMMIECCDRPHLHHAAVFEKYAERRFKEASLCVQSALDAGFMLPHQSSPIRRLSSQDSYRESSAEVQYASHGQLVPIEG